uniref:Replicase n=1 Tax=Crocidura shantungensis peropuvirus 1 TaxID=3139519 RepID=A0AB38ZK02_9MONO
MARQFLYSRHLDNALTSDKIEFYLEHPELWEQRYPTIPYSYLTVADNGFVRGVNLFQWLHQLLTQHGSRDMATSQQLWGLLKKSASMSLDIQLQAMFHLFPRVQTGGFETRRDMACSYTNLRGMFHRKFMIVQIHYSLSEISQLGKHPFLLPQCPLIEFYYDMVILKSFPECPIVIPYSYLLGVFDRIEAEFAYYLYIALKSTSPLVTGLDYFNITEHISHFLWSTHKTLGVESARVCKLMEPLCLGACLEILDPTCNDTNFLPLLLADIRDAKPKIYPYVMDLANILRTYLNTHDEDGIPVILEQYGHEKRFFYPIVDEDAGLLKMYKYGTEVREVDRGYIQDVKGLATIDYIVSYYNKYGHLPPIERDTTLDPRIQQILADGTPQSIDHCRKIPLSAWSVITFKKHRDFNYFEDVTDLLDDKAITPHRDNWRQMFAYDALLCLNMLKKRPREDTKLILAILGREEIDIRQFYEEVERLGGLPSRWTLIQAMAKERELKIEARMFSILILEVRMMCSAAERNIKEGLFPLLPQQSITMSGPELKSVLDTMVTRQLTSDSVWVVYNLDLEQWNYTFRFSVQHPFTCLLGQIFGVQHFTTVLSVFLDSTIVSSRRFKPPGTPGSVTHWDVHIGGNQGIFQALWSWITIEIEREVLLRHPYKFLEIGSGDNRVLLVQFPKTPDLNQHVLNLREELRTAFNRAGLALKVEETWYSSEILAYQRKYWFRGQQVENGIKQANRAYAGGSDIALGVDELITTAMNGGLTIAEVTADPYIGPLFAYMEGLGALCCHPQFKKSELAKGVRLALLPLFNTDFGYYPFMQLTGFLSAGHPDSLTDSLALVRQIWAYNPQLRPSLSIFLNWVRDSNRHQAFENLVLSPSSLYLKKPAPMSAHLKQAVQKHLFTPGVVKNRKVRDLLASVSRVNRSQFINSLTTIQPINSSLLNTLLETSYIGQVEAMVNHFNRVGSLLQITQLNRLDSGEEDFQSTVNRLDSQFMRYLSSRIQQTRAVRDSWIQTLMGNAWDAYNQFCLANKLTLDCSFSARLFLTSYTHYLSPNLVLGPYTPSAIEQVVPYLTYDPALLPSSIIVSPAHAIPQESVLLSKTRGPFKPLLGSATSNPARTIRLSSLQGLDVAKSVRELLKIYAWFVGMGADRPLLQYIRGQLDAKIPNISRLADILVSGTRGGTFEHRFAMLGQVMGAYSNNPSAISTWYQLSTNEASMLQRGSEDRFVFFQVLFQHIMGGLRFCGPVDIRWYCLVTTAHCGTVIPEQRFQAATGQYLSLLTDPHITPLAPSVEKKLTEETNHLLMIAGLPRRVASLGEEAMCAVIGHQFARSMKQYQLGGSRSITHYQTGGAPQSQYNVTLFRMVSTPALLTSLALHLFHHHVWTTSSSLVKFKQVLIAMTSRSSTLQDSFPYMALIEALVTAGHLPELVTLTQTPCKWAIGSLHTQLVGILLKGVLYGVEHLIQRRVKAVLLVEAQTAAYHWPYLWRTLCALHKPFREFIRLYPCAGPKLGLMRYYKTNPVVVCWCTSDHHLVEEQVRKQWKHYATRQQIQDYSAAPQSHVYPILPITPNAITTAGRGALLLNSNTISLEAFNDLLNTSVTQQSKMLYSIGRWGGVSSSARLKILHLVGQAPLASDVLYNHICLAEGAGSYVSVILHHRAKDTAIYNSLLPPEDLPHCFSTSFTPYECLCPCRIDTRIINKLAQHTCMGDLTKDETWNEILLAHQSTGKPCGIVTFDMEGFGDGKLYILSSLSHLIRLLKPQTVIVKLFVSDLTKQAMIHLTKIGQLFRRVQFVKPDASNLWASELFFVSHQWGTPVEVDITKLVGELLEQWHNALSEALPSVVWRNALNMSLLWNNNEICPLSRPSTNSWVVPYHHPVSELLINIAHSLCWLAADNIDLGLILPRGTSHMFASQSRGTKATIGFFNGVLTGISLLLAWLGFTGNDIPRSVSLEMLQSRSDEDISNLMKALHPMEHQGDRTLFLKVLGEIVSCDKLIVGSEVRGLLGVLRTIIFVLPRSWGLAKNLMNNMSLMDQICPVLVFPRGSLASVVTLNVGVRDQVRGLVSLAVKKIGHYPPQVLTVPSSLAGALVVAGVVEVMCHSPLAPIRVTDRGATNISVLDPSTVKFHIQWAESKVISTEELEKAKIVHQIELDDKLYYLGIWWGK